MIFPQAKSDYNIYKNNNNSNSSNNKTKSNHLNESRPTINASAKVMNQQHNYSLRANKQLQNLQPPSILILPSSQNNLLQSYKKNFARLNSNQNQSSSSAFSTSQTSAFNQYRRESRPSNASSENDSQSIHMKPKILQIKYQTAQQHREEQLAKQQENDDSLIHIPLMCSSTSSSSYSNGSASFVQPFVDCSAGEDRTTTKSKLNLYSPYYSNKNNGSLCIKLKENPETIGDKRQKAVNSIVLNTTDLNGESSTDIVLNSREKTVIKRNTNIQIENYNYDGDNEAATEGVRSSSSERGAANGDKLHQIEIDSSDSDEDDDDIIYPMRIEFESDQPTNNLIYNSSQFLLGKPSHLVGRNVAEYDYDGRELEFIKASYRKMSADSTSSTNSSSYLFSNKNNKRNQELAANRRNDSSRLNSSSNQTINKHANETKLNNDSSSIASSRENNLLSRNNNLLNNNSSRHQQQHLIQKEFKFKFSPLNNNNNNNSNNRSYSLIKSAPFNYIDQANIDDEKSPKLINYSQTAHAPVIMSTNANTNENRRVYSYLSTMSNSNHHRPVADGTNLIGNKLSSSIHLYNTEENSFNDDDLISSSNKSAFNLSIEPETISHKPSVAPKPFDDALPMMNDDSFYSVFNKNAKRWRSMYALRDSIRNLTSCVSTKAGNLPPQQPSSKKPNNWPLRVMATSETRQSMMQSTDQISLTQSIYDSDNGGFEDEQQPQNNNENSYLKRATTAQKATQSASTIRSSIKNLFSLRSSKTKESIKKPDEIKVIKYSDNFKMTNNKSTTIKNEINNDKAQNSAETKRKRMDYLKSEFKLFKESARPVLFKSNNDSSSPNNKVGCL